MAETSLGVQSMALLTVVFGYFEGVPGAAEVGTSDNQLRAAYGLGSGDDGVQVIWVSSCAMMYTPVNRICEIDSNLFDKSC